MMMCAVESTVYRFWKLGTYVIVLENHSFPEKTLKRYCRRRWSRTKTEVGEGVRMAGEEREGSCGIFPKYFYGLCAVPTGQGRVSKGCKVGQHLISL